MKSNVPFLPRLMIDGKVAHKLYLDLKSSRRKILVTYTALFESNPEASPK